jgi:hypothetical protein
MNEIPKTKEELNNFIKEYIQKNLKIRINQSSKYYGGSSTVTISISIENEEFTTEYIDLPNEN